MVGFSICCNPKGACFFFSQITSIEIGAYVQFVVWRCFFIAVVECFALFFFLTQDTLRKIVETLKLNIGWSLICSLFEIYTGAQTICELIVCRFWALQKIHCWIRIHWSVDWKKNDLMIQIWPLELHSIIFSMRKERVCIFILRFRFFFSFICCSFFVSLLTLEFAFGFS